MTTSSATTRDIRVDVRARYIEDHSNPQEHQWFFAYEITIQNLGTDTVQLLAREWIITNSTGEVETVKGPGVVGHQPKLAPKEGFQYTSGCPLNSAFGTMKGKYFMVNDAGEHFEIDVAEFALVDPAALN